MDSLEFQQLEFDEISTLTLDDLRQSGMVEKIRNTVLALDRAKESGVALNLIKKLDELIELAEKDKAGGTKIDLKKYQDDVALLKFVSLVYLTDKEIDELFRTNLIFAIRSEIMVLDQVHQYIVTYENQEIRSKFADGVIKAISYNEEDLGNNQIFLVTEKKPVEPKLRNWIRSYNQDFDPRLKNAVLQEGEYLSTNKDVLKLPIEERKILEQVIKLYDFLRFPDQLSKRIITTKTLPNRPISAPITTADANKPQGQAGNETAIIQAYQGDERQRKDLARAEKKIIKKFKDDIVKLRAEFFKSVQAKDVMKTIVILRILAQKQDLEKLLKEDEKLFKFLAVTWAKQYGQELSTEFQKNPSQFKFVRLFLQYVLQQRLGMPRSEAARVGMQIGNIMSGLGKKEYKQMAYFEVSSKTFNWFED